jgi:uncharacterized protein (DUF58 family)
MKRRIEIDVSKSIKRLHIITKQLITEEVVGGYKSVFKGKGLEFDSYRNYAPDDDASMIDWKASKRANQLMVRKYVEERDMNVFFLVDVSNSMIFGSSDKLKNEYSAELVVALSHAILIAGDKVGMALFNDKIVSKVPPNLGMKQFNKIVRTLKNPENYGGGFDLNGALNFPLNYLKYRGVLFIISDFIGMRDENWKRPLKWLSTKFDVVCVMIRDPRDKMIPKDIKGQVLISDPYSGRELLIEPKVLGSIYEKYVNEQEKEIKNIMRDCKADFITIYTDKSFVKPILNLFNMRKKRWR